MKGIWGAWKEVCLVWYTGRVSQSRGRCDGRLNLDPNMVNMRLFLKTKKMSLASLVAQTVKNLPAIQDTQVWSMSCKNSLEKGMTIHSSILAWKIPWAEKPGGFQSMGSQGVGHDWATNTFTFNNKLALAMGIAVYLYKDYIISYMQQLQVLTFNTPWNEF